MTEGFEYIQESESFISIGYAKRTESYQKYEIWFPRWEEKIQKIAQVLIEAGFKVELKTILCGGVKVSVTKEFAVKIDTELASWYHKRWDLRSKLEIANDTKRVLRKALPKSC
jgi:hypothetical protein